MIRLRDSTATNGLFGARFAGVKAEIAAGVMLVHPLDVLQILSGQIQLIAMIVGIPVYVVHFGQCNRARQRVRLHARIGAREIEAVF